MATDNVSSGANNLYGFVDGSHPCPQEFLASASQATASSSLAPPVSVSVSSYVVPPAAIPTAAMPPSIIAGGSLRPGGVVQSSSPSHVASPTVPVGDVQHAHGQGQAATMLRYSPTEGKPPLPSTIAVTTILRRTAAVP
nr:hypothetical protein Iba_chr13cCG12600 [Ipomoea batatas]